MTDVHFAGLDSASLFSSCSISDWCWTETRTLKVVALPSLAALRP